MNDISHDKYWIIDKVKAALLARWSHGDCNSHQTILGQFGLCRSGYPRQVVEGLHYGGKIFDVASLGFEYVCVIVHPELTARDDC